MRILFSVSDDQYCIDEVNSSFPLIKSVMQYNKLNDFTRNGKEMQRFVLGPFNMKRRMPCEIVSIVRQSLQ